MTEPATSQPAPDQAPRQESSAAPGASTRFRAGAVIVLAVAVGIILWLTLRGGSSGTSAKAFSAQQIGALATSLGHPIFWLGPRQGTTYDLRRTSDGSIYVRYLPSGVNAGASGQYLTVATYPFRGAFRAIKRVVRQSDTTSIKLPHTGLAEYTTSNPKNVHAAYPGIDYQVEVFDPSGNSVAIVKSGQLTSFGGPQGAPAPKPAAASPARLRAFAASVGHPVYWTGPKPGFTYELTHTFDGNVYIRYLPAGVKIGAGRHYLTIGTYPFRGAFAAIQRVLKQTNVVKIRLAGGGLAALDVTDPDHIHLAYPGSDYQVEVFDPSGRARRIVSSGQVKAIG